MGARTDETAVCMPTALHPTVIPIPIGVARSGAMRPGIARQAGRRLFLHGGARQGMAGKERQGEAGRRRARKGKAGAAWLG